jgi:hypothetical protein
MQEESDREEQDHRDERDYDVHVPYYDQPARHHSPDHHHLVGGIRPYSRRLRRVTWPPNFKPMTIDKYDGSTNPVE